VTSREINADESDKCTNFKLNEKAARATLEILLEMFYA